MIIIYNIIHYKFIQINCSTYKKFTSSIRMSSSKASKMSSKYTLNADIITGASLSINCMFLHFTKLPVLSSSIYFEFSTNKFSILSASKDSYLYLIFLFRFSNISKFISIKSSIIYVYVILFDPLV